jgi:hypothetical protein
MAVERLSQASILTLQKYSSMVAGYVPAADYELISTQLLTTTSASVVFDTSTLASSGYNHLQIRAVVRDNRASAGSNCYMRFNSDTGSNYSHHQLWGSGSSASSSNATSQTSMYITDITGGSGTANAYSPFIVEIQDFALTTKTKTARFSGGTNAGYNWVNIGSGAWYSTSAITSITIFDTLGSFVSGSRFSLYGYRG